MKQEISNGLSQPEAPSVFADMATGQATDPGPVAI